MSLLKAEGLSKSYRQGEVEITVLNALNLEVKPGETLAILGASGSGKSTLLHLLGGLDKPTQGAVYINQASLHDLSEKKKGNLRNRYLGFIYQFHHLLPEFTALENVAMGLLIRGTSLEEAVSRSQDLLEKVGLKSRATHKPGELSGGERQRVAIARALATEPQCVLADEPTGNLDRKTADQVFATLLAINKTLNTSLIIVTHDPKIANQMDIRYSLEDGQLVAVNSR